VFRNTARSSPAVGRKTSTLGIRGGSRPCTVALWEARESRRLCIVVMIEATAPAALTASGTRRNAAHQRLVTKYKTLIMISADPRKDSKFTHRCCGRKYRSRSSSVGGCGRSAKPSRSRTGRSLIRWSSTETTINTVSTTRTERSHGRASPTENDVYKRSSARMMERRTPPLHIYQLIEQVAN